MGEIASENVGVFKVVFGAQIGGICTLLTKFTTEKLWTEPLETETFLGVLRELDLLTILFGGKRLYSSKTFTSRSANST